MSEDIGRKPERQDRQIETENRAAEATRGPQTPPEAFRRASQPGAERGHQRPDREPQGRSAGERPGASCGAAAGRRPGADPPLLTGGLSHLKASDRGIEGLWAVEKLSRDVDYLTVSVSTDVARELIAQTEMTERGKASQGFELSELRKCVGGTCWRRWGPRQPSKRFGTDYESWLYAGPSAGMAATVLRDHEAVQPSRVDVAFDFLCHPELRPDDLVELWGDDIGDARIEVGIEGHAGVNTLYVGSKKSDRFVRVYRKDRQDRSYAFAFGGQGVMRVELELRKKFARPWWELWREDEERGFAAAADHIRQMTGALVQTATERAPSVLIPEATCQAAKLQQFLTQYGSLLAALVDAGVPVIELARAMQRCTKSRKRQSRYRQQLEALQDAGPFWRALQT